jgi:hypothetical protein
MAVTGSSRVATADHHQPEFGTARQVRPRVHCPATAGGFADAGNSPERSTA